jgi:hypothetical protein
MTNTTASVAQAGEFVATEIAWWGCCSERLVADKLTAAGFAVDAATVLAFAVESGLVKRSVMGFTASRKTNAKVFGRRFAEWVAA